MQKTVKEWWDDSGFGTVLYWEDSRYTRKKVVLIGATGSEIMIWLEDCGVYSLESYQILSDKPPKKKVKKYIWIVKRSDGFYGVTSYHYESKTHAQIGIAASSESIVVQRIDESMIEVEE